MSTALDAIRRQIARLEKSDPNGRFLNDLKQQLAAFETAPDQSAEAMYYRGNPVVPTSQPVPRGKLPEPPTRDQFPSQDEFEEAMGYWQSHVGRIKAMADRAQRSKDSPAE